MFVASALFFISTIRAHERGKRAAYYSQRRASRRHAGRQGMRALATLVLGVVFLIVAEVLRSPTSPQLGTAPAASSTPIAVAEAPHTIPTAPPAPTPTLPQPTETPTPTPTPSPSPTPLPATATPLVQLTPLIATPTLNNERRLQLIGIAEALDERGMPVHSATRFISGTQTLYVVFEYRNVPPNALLRHTWFRDGSSVYFDTVQLPREAIGIGHITWSPEGGFAPGVYEVRLALGNVLQFVANFEVYTS